MYEMNGYVYAGNPSLAKKIIYMETAPEHQLVAQFNDGEIRAYDCSPLLEMGAFSPLRDFDVFNSASLFHGVPTWCDGEIDIAPEEIYECGKRLAEWPANEANRA